MVKKDDDDHHHPLFHVYFRYFFISISFQSPGSTDTEELSYKKGRKKG
jgi:hypothetical protein